MAGHQTPTNETTTTAPGEGGPAAGRGPGQLTGGWRIAAGVAAAGMVALGVLGAVVSFASVREAMAPSFGGLAWTVPVGVDLGVAVFTALDLILVRAGMRMRSLRLVPWGLVAVTIYLNVASEDDLIGAVGHGVLPLLWVLAVEVVIHVMRDLAGLAGDEEAARAERRARGHMDRVRLSRWLLAPTSTVALWRRMKLWEERSYPRALARERDRVLARCDLQDSYGRWAWRWRAPRRERALYRLGELAPAGVPLDDTPVAAASSSPGAGQPGGDASAPRHRRAPAPPTTSAATAAGGGRRKTGTAPASGNAKRGAAAEDENRARRQAAAAEWRQSVAAGVPLTGAELARRYGMSPRWGTNVIRQAADVQERADAPDRPAADDQAPATGTPGTGTRHDIGTTGRGMPDRNGTTGTGRVGDGTASGGRVPIGRGMPDRHGMVGTGRVGDGRTSGGGVPVGNGNENTAGVVR